MSFEEQSDFADQVADLNRYGQALNSCETTDEVVSLTLEAVSLLFDFSYATFVEVVEGEPVIADSTNPNQETGTGPSTVAMRAVESGETVIETGTTAGVTDGSNVTATLAVPGVIVDDVVLVLVIRGTEVEEVGEEYARPLEILASHAATAVSNIRSREQLERARDDLEKRKEMIELYDKLLRHDLGNDLQVITGFADIIANEVDGEMGEYAARIESAAGHAADLIDRVGGVVSTLEREEEPEPRSLRAVLQTVVRKAEAQHESLTIEFDPEAFDYRVYGGDLLDTVFLNIISNAAVHNDKPVTVSLYSEVPTPDTVVIGIVDDGAGVPDAVRDEIFEMGVKGPQSNGTGLGLGFVRALTESYGGTVELRDSEPGAEFRVTLVRV